MNKTPRFFQRLAQALLATTYAAALAAGTPLTAQEETFGEEKRITAIDLVVAFEAGAVRDWASENTSPANPEPEDFEIVLDGEPRTVIAAAPATAEWQIVIVFDAVLTGSTGLRRAAEMLAESADALTELGEVTILVADPAPRTLLSASRDRDRLHASLAQLARTQEGRDELVALRSQTVAALRQDSPQAGRDVLTALPQEEARIVRARHDDLLLALVDSAAAGPLRALIVAGGSYDLRPQEFYRPLIAPEMATDAEAAPAASLAAATDTLGRTLAAYGWLSLYLLPPEPDAAKDGVRLGKLRLTKPSVEVEEQTAFYEQYDRTVIKLFGAKLEGTRKPKRAEAYLELATALQGQGKPEEAEEALRQAIHHFASDPKTAERQAQAFVLLGKVLEEQEKAQESTAAFELARRLDPQSAAAGAGPIAGLIAPTEPLETLARATAGEVLRDTAELGKALEGLRQRVWITYQVTGPPDGELHALTARWLPSQRRLRYPGWARSSIPEPVAAARARWLLAAGEPTGGTLEIEADYLPASGAVDVELGLTAEEVRTVGNDAVLRLTLGIGGPDVEPWVEHRHFGPQSLVGRDSWGFRASVEVPADGTWLAVLVEDLDTGSWGGRLIELP